MKRVDIRLLLIAVILACSALPALATQIIRQSPEELAKSSPLIVDGTVSGVRSYWNPDHSKIITETTVAVGATHKGANTTSVRVVQLGGVVGNVRQTAHGALAWERGEEVLLFLEPSTPGAYQVVGFSQGKFEIERDARTGRAFVQQAMPPDARASAPSTTAAPRDEKVTLEQFLSQVLPRK